MIVIAATFQAKPGSEAELEKALRTMIAPVSKEAGAIEYALHRSPTDAGRFFFYEKYKDQAAGDFHSATPYLKALLETAPGLCVTAPSVEVYEPLVSIHD